MREIRRDIARIRDRAVRWPGQSNKEFEQCRSAYLQGVVVSDKNDKTIVVEVERRLDAPGAEEDGATVQEVSCP